MQASNLRLEHYFLEELHFALNDRCDVEAIERETPLRAENVDVTVEAGQNPDNQLEWLFRLKIRLDDKESEFPYDFTIKMAGFFNVSEGCEGNMREQLATINGPSLLYGAAREILATISARSRFVPVFLPPIRFFGMTRERPLEQKALPASESEKSTTKRKPKKVAKKR